jgi:hypothetical protein
VRARLDGHNHRPVAGDSDLAEATKVLARAHQNLICTRQRQVNQFRSMLREFDPAALEAFEDLAMPHRCRGMVARVSVDARSTSRFV